MTLFQATTVIMGANIGTTITAQIAALSSFDFTKFFYLFAVVGIFMAMFTKNNKINAIGLIMAGFGLVFVGLKIMSGSFADLNEGGVVNSILQNIKNPFLLLLIGVFLTALTQSSSAITSVLIVMAAQGINIGGGGNAVLYIVLGTNIGSCVTALLSSIGTSANARRASLIHLMFNVFGSVIFFIMLILWPSFMDVTFAKWFPGVAGTQIAMFHTAFNTICTLIFIWFVKVFVYISNKLIKDKVDDKPITYLDKRLLSSPDLALNSVHKEAALVMERAMSIFEKALKDFEEVNLEDLEQTDKAVDGINEACKNITDYLVKISANDISVNTEKEISALHHSMGDIVRVAELAQNFTKYTRRRERDGLNFSNKVIKDLEVFKDKIFELYELVKQVVLNKDLALIDQIDQMEDAVDDVRRTLVDAHIKRLNKGECRAESSSVFVNLVNNMERIADHLHAVAHNAE
jgi:phosphate:Na+ symporter